MDMIFDADILIGVYRPTEEEPDKAIALAIRLQKAGTPIQFEFTTGDPLLLEGMAATFIEVAAAQRACAANVPYIGQSKNEVGAIDAPNNPDAESGEGTNNG